MTRPVGVAHLIRGHLWQLKRGVSSVSKKQPWGKQQKSEPGNRSSKTEKSYSQRKILYSVVAPRNSWRFEVSNIQRSTG